MDSPFVVATSRSNCTNATAAEMRNYHLFSNCRMETGTLCLLRLLSLAYSLKSLRAAPWCHLDSQSGILLETPEMCLAFITN